MRCGLIRHGPDLPPPEEQAAFVEAASCDRILDFKVDALTAKNVSSTLTALRKGDQLRVMSLSVISPQGGQLLRLLSGLAEIGVAFEVSDGEGGEIVVDPNESVVGLLRLLTFQTSGRRAAEDTGRADRRPLWTAENFSKHQVAHARKLYGDGHSLREIGMIFLTSPEEVWKVISR